MASKWYLVGNKTELEASGLTEQSQTMYLEGNGTKTVYFFFGMELGLFVDTVFMLIGEGEKDVTVRNGYALWLDPETQDLYLGIEDAS